ncbi:hypothetical protein DFA_10427 [Cavenderia fasciculata]|uniref:Uncharacterized protein n=1 Tax=Cavenderia fasciculata TaxID=261658 RepID=F4QA66_CACFS|nr:uncharacterized protein DFA_10427 [Cavenderia fasciculata]EGG15585.1 hypothetical protein DFA_10427 [Cavenderia fasciculata]|eukprot:XP_004354327.1 hypothetical protein DFA_10427 [Cavenderia fasciculata]
MSTSPLGATMNQFVGNMDNNVYLAYNDHALRVNAKKRLYAWSSRKGFPWMEVRKDKNDQETGVKKGLLLQHSLPKWPIQTNPEDQGSFNAPYSTYDADFSAATSGSDLQDGDKKRVSPFFGWNQEFFGINLMSYIRYGSSTYSLLSSLGGETSTKKLLAYILQSQGDTLAEKYAEYVGRDDDGGDDSEKEEEPDAPIEDDGEDDGDDD